MYSQMKVLFLTLVEIHSIDERGIYQDLLRKFRDEGHDVTIVTPIERRRRIPTRIESKNGVTILKVKTFNIQKTNVVEKAIGTLAIEHQYIWAIKKHLSNIRFDLILYSTPPITFASVVDFVRKRDKARTYLLLKDIFPQNAVDMDMIKEGSIIHRYFLRKEKTLYQISDTIGCMSPANLDYVLRHNPEIVPEKLEVNPNTIEPISFMYSADEKNEIRGKYSIPEDKKVLVYGGNLGKPQGLDFLMETITATEDDKIFFLVVGNGTEFSKIKQWFDINEPVNARLLQRLPKDDYDRLLAACDVGLIFLDKKFLIPNFPSRLLSYLEMAKPVIAATDPNTDIGDIIEQARCGYKVLAGDQIAMQTAIYRLLYVDDLQEMAENAVKLLRAEYLVEKSYRLIKRRCGNV
ncbi:glycosyltransferase involved in cell wall biosynthesis [Sphingobacterium allocomposti]|uniref:Glycosyltransferase involved in cell wall biosynthesis n=2 Tax=Sphingobacterium allocomposti TaxID=415956 RepID=A0A5S5DF87_9SPHI|nr:glycosyltransferase involved in cell wall biosynthesis [Sphingobacterium composti Yoo et al. 2007 non Ten et al. 2007]